jgi:Tol biopolymer transport system component
MLVVEVSPAEATLPGKNGKIAYLGFDGNDPEIYTIYPGGKRRVQVTRNNTKDCAPSYSPDSKKIAYTDFSRPTDFEIYTINVDGGSRVKVTDNNTRNTFPP